MVSSNDVESTSGRGQEERVRDEVVKPRRKAVDVRVAEYRREAVVVEVKSSKEWYRSVVPLSALRLTGDGIGVVFDDDLAAGLYGEDWTALAESLVKDFPKRLADALHEQGIFSYADLRAKGPQAKVAIMNAYRFNLVALMQKEK